MTVTDFQDFLRGLNQPAATRAAYLVGKYPDVVEPFLDRIEQRLIAKGLWKRRASYSPISAPSGPVRGRRGGTFTGSAEYESPAAGYDRAHASRELTDREGFEQLAALVDTALASEPAEFRAAIKSTFLEEAAKAA